MQLHNGSHANEGRPPSMGPTGISEHKQNSAFRPNRLLSKVVPPLLGLFILKGWQYVTFTMGELSTIHRGPG